MKRTIISLGILLGSASLFVAPVANAAPNSPSRHHAHRHSHHHQPVHHHHHHRHQPARH